MHRVRTLWLVVAVVLATSATAASTASAKAPLLTLTEGLGGSLLTTGATFEADSENTGFVTSLGLISCNGSFYNRIYGKVAINQATKDLITIESATGEIAGVEPCTSTTGLGSVYVYMFGFPWTLSVGSTGKAELRTPGEMLVNMDFSGGAQCEYSAKKVKGSANVTSSPTPLTVKFLGQKFKMLKEFSSKVCPKSASMNIEFVYLYGGAAFETVYAHN